MTARAGLNNPPPEDVPEPYMVIGLLAVGCSGSLLKKKINKS